MLLGGGRTTIEKGTQKLSLLRSSRRSRVSEGRFGSGPLFLYEASFLELARSQSGA